MSVKTHFTNEKYDAIKYNARTKTGTPSHFERRHDKGLFSMLSKNFDSSQEAASYFVANLTYGNEYPLTDFEKGELLYKRWQRNRQSLFKMFKDDIQILLDTEMCYNDLVNEEHIPQLFMMMKNGKVNIETLAIMNQFSNFVDKWKKKHALFAPEFLRIKKLSSFLKFDKEKYGKIYSELNHEVL